MDAPASVAPAWRWDRYAPLTGIVAVVLWVVGVGIAEKTDRPEEDPVTGEQLATWFQDERSAILAGNLIFVLGALFFVWFVGSLSSTLRFSEGWPARLSSLVFGGGLLVGLAMIVSAAAEVQGAFSDDELTGDSALTLSFISDMFFGVTEVFGVLLLVAVGLAILRTRALPVWLAWLTLALALILFVFPIGWIGVIIGLPLWTLITSALLFWRPARA